MAEQEHRSFVIEGPDVDGFVWICSAAGREDWCRNLGTLADAAEVMSEWLGAVDHLERQ